MTFRTSAILVATLTATLAVAGCSTTPQPGTSSSPATGASSGVASSDGAPPSPPAIPDPSVVLNGAPTATVASVTPVASDLAAPWDLIFMPDGSMLVSARDAATIARVRSGVATTLNGPGAEVLRGSIAAGGEGGLLGLAISPHDPTLLYAYITRQEGNAVVRMSLTGELLSAPVDVVTGIPRAKNHNGGRIAFGPDGYLYITTGDAGDGANAQDKDSLAGKILRVVADGGEDDGSAAPGNPFDSLVWSMGHRNVEGLGWAADHRMYATEFGQDSTDELNLIVPGANYGWPEVEARTGAPAGTELGSTVDGFTYPVAEWPTDEASPSGMTVTGDAIYVAALRGEGIWRIPLTQDSTGTPARLDVDFGRVRDIEVGPGGPLYVVTNNTDGRGEARSGDDHIYRLELE